MMMVVICFLTIFKRILFARITVRDTVMIQQDIMFV